MIVANLLRFSLTLLCCLAWLPAAASMQPIKVTDTSVLPAHFQYWEDANGEAELDQVRNLPDSAWQHEPTGSASLGFTPSTHWLRFAVNNTSSDLTNLIAELAYPQLDDVIFHELSNSDPVRIFETGDSRPFYPRLVDHPNMLLRLTLQPGQTKTLYVRVETKGPTTLPLRLWHETDFFSAASHEQKLHFFYYGCLAVIILINLAVFLMLRERLYLYYALAISGYLLFFASIKGYSFQLLYPQAPGLHAKAVLASMPILALFSLLFCRNFLRTPEHSPRLDLAIKVMIGFEVLNAIAAITLDYNTAIRLSSLSALAFFSLLFLAGPIAWATGVRAGAFFTVAWTPLTVGVLATAGRALGVLPTNFFTEHAMQIGSGLEAFILTLALADRLYREREDKISAQADSLRQEKARNHARQELTEAMTHDPVTGLPNRNRFERMVNAQLANDPDGAYMVGVARITRLDEINRTLGLNRSERLLRTLAAEMTGIAMKLPEVFQVQDSLGRYECVYQLSGDCFGILVHADRATANFEGLNQALEMLGQPIPLDNLAIELHPKFGAAVYPAHGDNAALLIRNAHVGMEIAPRGLLATGFYSQDLDIYSEGRLTLMSDLREAIQNDQAQLYYQPKLSLVTGRVVGVEALMRWHHPERGWVSPSDFIPLAEETGVIRQLTRWAVERGVRDLAGLMEENPGLDLSINISARDLTSRSLKGHIESVLGHHGIQAQRLTLELTETAAMEDPEKGLKALKSLAESGIGISIDDFGSGYSSLSYLKELPATEIKLDRSLVTDICSNESSRVIIETAINMVHGLGYGVIAEGVEDEATARLLKGLGCDKLQGYWLGRPMPLPALKSWLTDYPEAILSVFQPAALNK